MKLSQIINYPLGLFGLRVIRKSGPALSEETGMPPDIARDTDFLIIYEKVKQYTMVDLERCYSLYKSVQYIVHNDIPGDLVECGVWKGGCCMLIAFTLLKAGVRDRRIWLFDTFSGMTKPGEHDGKTEQMNWENNKKDNDKNDWCYASIEETKSNLGKTGYPLGQLEFVKGKVEETIPGRKPDKISLLRLDTDWYDSTKHELFHLYPLMGKGAVLIIDDYGVWQGSRKATDEYFGNTVYLNRPDWSSRMVIKDEKK